MRAPAAAEEPPLPPMPSRDFVHLHVHSHFSLLDGNCQLDDLLDTVQAAGQDAIALTDHGNLYGAAHFFKAAKRRGLKPILGMEAYIASGSRFEKKRVILEGRTKSTFHATLLAMDEEGFANLLRLASTAFVDGFYYKPRIDRAAMREHARGLVCLSGCLAGEVNQALLAGRPEEAERIIREYQDIFGRENFYLEVMNHGLDLEDQVRRFMPELGRATGARLVATNDIHYVRPPDWEAQDVALCIGTGKTVADEDRFRMRTRELYFKTTEEMVALFAGMPEAVRSTREIADRCSFELPFGRRCLPAFPAPAGETSEGIFRRLCREGVARRYPEVTEAIAARLEYEISMIVRMGFVDYFLIVWDFIRYAREQGIPVGPGRGSAAGSIVAYALGITALDPLRYDLLFERFLNPERISMPDIDIDFCKDRRGEVIRYVQEKYGSDRVSLIITFGTMKARSVIRDVGRALAIPLPDVDRIAKKIPNGPKDTLRGALESDGEVRDLASGSEEARRLFDVALKLEGAPRHASIHAAGVVISDRPLVERVPLCRTSDEITTQWPMDVLEDIGLLKMDFLGLRTLTIIREAAGLIRDTTGVLPDIDSLPLDDPRTYAMLARGDAEGVFQLESEGMRKLLRRLRPDRFEDLIAVLALYRPGPLGAGMVDTYVRRKHGQEPTTYPHPCLEPILAGSFGVILYQEQVMRIANVLSGFSLAEADNLRKAMSKKRPEILARFKERFVEGAVARNVRRETAAEIFDLIEYFAGYGFNKSHSAAYALITYQTAWLKANHPVEFMAALLSCEMIDIDKTVQYIEECHRQRIRVLPPDVNRSGARFTVEDGAVRYALAALKGVGMGAAEAVVAARASGGPFHNLFDLAARVDGQRLNKIALEALIAAGATDSLPGNRAQKLAAVAEAMAVGAAIERDRRRGQASLFGDEDEAPETAASALPALPELPESDRLQREKAAIGFYLTGHPLNRHREILRRFATLGSAQVLKSTEEQEGVLGGIIASVRPVLIRNGRNAGHKIAILRVEDFTGSVEATVFSDLYAKCRDWLVPDRIAFFMGQVDLRRDTPGFRVREVIPLDEAPLRLSRRLTLDVEAGDALDLVIPALHRVLRAHPGKLPVYFSVRIPEFGKVVVEAGAEYRIALSPPLLAELAKLLGPERVVLN
jgi:DNA polymerase-3 subunit alpha